MSGAQPRTCIIVSRISQEDVEKLDEAVVEIASRVGQCVTAQGDTMLALNDHSDLLTEAKTDINSLKNENKKLTKRLDNIDVAFKAALERVDCV